MLDDTQRGLGDMRPEELRRHGSSVLDWIAEYRARVAALPVQPQVQPGQTAALIPDTPPEEPEPFADILADLDRVLLPGLVHWNHPGFLGYFAITGSGPGILAEAVAAALNVNGMLWATAPAATELEQRVLGWLWRMLGLGEPPFAFICDTASVATFSALAAARERAGLSAAEEGLAGRELPQLAVYTSAQAHSSVDKAAMALGIGRANVRRIPTDPEFRMDVDALAQRIAADRAAGVRPLAVVATVGTTSTTSVDPVADIAAVCAAEDLWLHVDAAYGGIAAVVPEYRWVLSGVEHADSLVVNPHKWLFTPIDLSAFYVRDPEALRAAFSLRPPYLDGAGGVDLMEYTLPLGRRLRALKLWWVLRYFGRRGIEARIREHLRLGALARDLIDAHPALERVAPVPFSVVCFRATYPGATPEELDALNRRVLAEVNASGEVFLSHTELDGRFVLRLAVGHLDTSERHVRRAVELVAAAAEREGASGSGSPTG